MFRRTLRQLAQILQRLRRTRFTQSLPSLKTFPGIFGLYSSQVKHTHQEVLEILFEGLRRLEYRGYDSAGVCVDWPDEFSVSRWPRKPLVIKAKGKVDELVKLANEIVQRHKVDTNTAQSTHIAIAHTRWATHGPPCALNSHPHVSSGDNEFVVVHNGTITNFHALKEFLIREGEVFETDTDTEVIPKLCRFLHYRLAEPISFPELISEVTKQLEGAYALLIKSSVYPNELIACRRGSPLILGVKTAHQEIDDSNRLNQPPQLWDGVASIGCTALKSKNEVEIFLASEASAIVEHTKKVIYLEDNDIVHMRAGGYAIFNRTGLELMSTQVRRTIHTLTMEVSQIMKGGYDHYMQKEIFEQPETIAQTMRGRVTTVPLECAAMHKSYPQVTNAVHLGGLTDHVPTIRRSRRLMFIGCGTSYHAAMCARQTVEELCEIPVVLELASDLLDRRCPLFRDDTCIFVSQSGETADTMRALEYAKVSGALCLGITNTVGSAIARNTHAGIHINAGAEIGVASTKAYTSQIVAITMIALVLSEDTISKRQRRDEIINSMINLPDAIGACLELDTCIRKLAEELKDEPNLLIFGRGRNYATAMEGALKVKEVSYMHSEGLNAGEMKHGPLALVDETMPIILVCTMDEIYSKMQGVLQQLMARNARLIILCHQGDKDISVVAGNFFPLIQVPKVDDALQPVVNIIPLQLLSYHLTLLRGYNVDQPRNLAKSVTVTEE